MALILLHLVMGHRYAAAWASDAALWRWAAQSAPQKFRPWMNYQKAVSVP